MKTSFKTSNNMLYGIIGILLSLVLVIGLIPVWSLRVDASPVGDPIDSIGDLVTKQSGKYYLTQDIGEDAQRIWQIHNGENITLDLNGKTIKNIRIDLYGTQSSLTLNDSVGTGKIDNNNVDGPTIYIYNQNTFIMNNGRLYNNNYGSVKNDGGEFIMNGGSIYGNKVSGTRCGAVYNEGEFIMNRGSIYDNEISGSFCGGVYNKGKFTMCKGSSIHDNDANGVYNDNDGIFTMENGSISNNIVKSTSGGCRGGGVYNNGKFTMKNGSISKNIVDSSFWSIGGGVYNTGTFEMYGGSIEYNESREDGGGVYNVGTFTMENGSIDYNRAKEQGGGVFNSQKSFNMYGGSISNNIAEESDGGGVVNTGSFTLTNATIKDNLAKKRGGGIFTISAISINGGTINNNKLSSNNAPEDIYLGYNWPVCVSKLSNSPNIGVITFNCVNNIHALITLLDPLTNTTPIGVGIDFDGNVTVPLTFTQKSDGGPNPSDYVFNFKSVNPNYGIGIDGNDLKLDTAAPKPTISLTPVDIKGQYGYDIRVPLSVEVTTIGNSEITGYQWYQNTTNSNTGGTPIAGATESAYTIPNGFGIGKYYYYCMVKTRSTDNNVFRQDPSNVGTLIVSKGDARYTTDVTAKNGLTEEKTPQELVNPGATNYGDIQYALGDNDTTAPTSGWSTSIPTGTNAGLYHVWYKVAGTTNYNGIEPKCVNVMINYKPGTYPSIPVTPGKIKNITGSKDAYQESNIYNTIIENEDELATLLDITDEDKAQGVNVWFDVIDATDSTLDADKAIIDAAKGDYQVGNYLTINVYKKVGNGFSYSKVKETNGKVKMKLTFSDRLKKQGRSFAIVGVHNLKGTLIGGSYNYDANTFSFANNEFSPYAIVYRDEVNPQAPVSVVTTKVSAVPKTRIK